MQYHHRNRLLPPPPPPPFGSGGGAGYPRGHKQLYAPPPPLPPMPPAPQHKYEVLMEAGRLAAEYLVSQGELAPAALQRVTGAWAVPPLPPAPPPLPQQLEPPAFYRRRRYEDEYSNNPSARQRWNNGTTSSSSNRDDYSSGSYDGRGKRKYGEYRRGYSDSGRDREKEKRRVFSNSRSYEEDEDGAPGFRRERRGSGGTDEVRSSITVAAREEMPLMAKVVELDQEDTKLKVVCSTEDIQKDADAVPEVQDENEGGELDDDSKVLNSESEVVEQAMDTDTNTSVMELESNQIPDGKVPDEEAEDSDKFSDEPAFDDGTLDIEVTNVESSMRDVTPNLPSYCDFARAPTRPRSARARRNAASVTRGTSLSEAVDLVSFEQVSQMVIDESAKQSFQSITKSENGEDQIYPENNNSSACSDEPMLLQENGTSAVTENIREEKGDEQPHVVQEYKEETSLSPFTASHVDCMPQEDSLMQGTDLSLLRACHKDSLMQETDLSSLTASHKNSFIEETKLSSLPVSHKDNLMQETDLSQAMSSHENNLKLQFNEGAKACDYDTLQQVEMGGLFDQREVGGADLCPNVGGESTIKMEEGRLDQSDSLKVSDLDLVGGTEVSASHDNITLAQSSAAGSSTEPHEKQIEDLGTTAGANTTDDLCQLPLENKDVQLTNIECNMPIEVGGFGSLKSKNEMVCSSIDNIMHPGLHADVLPGLQDSYGLAFSDFLSADIACYPLMQPDHLAGIGASDSEGITIMDDLIYGSLTDIGFMDVWGQPTQDYDKFF